MAGSLVPMDESALFDWLVEILTRHGPVVLFVACMLETTLFIGLIIPVGGLIAFSSMLSSRGVFSPEAVALSALVGAFLGDQLGFFIGRKFRNSATPGGGRLKKLWIGSVEGASRLLRGRGSAGIALARGIPFVRTIMPWLVGRSEIRYRTFLPFDLLGVGLWGAIYVGGGFLAGEGWREVAREFGELAGAIVAGLLLIALILITRRWGAEALKVTRKP